MKVLILSQHFWPETFPINGVARSLARAGIDVRVLTGKPNYPEGRMFPGYRIAGTKTETMDGIRVHRVPLLPRGRGGAVALGANYLSFILAALALGPGMLGPWRPDVVFTYGTSPILQGIAAIRIARTMGACAVTWVQDLWPESLEATGFVRNRHALGAVGRIVGWIYRRSDVVLVQSAAFVGPVRALAGATMVAVHPNPGESDGATSAEPAPAAIVLPRGFNIVFAGNLGTVQALSTILDVAARLADLPDVRIVIVGSGVQSGWLTHEVARRTLRNVSTPGRFAPEAIPAILAQADALLVTLARRPTLSSTVPSKIQTYLAAARPILAALDGEGARVIRAAGAGIVVSAEDAAGLADAARALHRMEDADRLKLGKAGRAYYERHFDPAVLTPALIAHFERAIAQRPAG